MGHSMSIQPIKETPKYSFFFILIYAVNLSHKILQILSENSCSKDIASWNFAVSAFSVDGHFHLQTHKNTYIFWATGQKFDALIDF